VQNRGVAQADKIWCSDGGRRGGMGCAACIGTCALQALRAWGKCVWRFWVRCRAVGCHASVCHVRHRCVPCQAAAAWQHAAQMFLHTFTHHRDTISLSSLHKHSTPAIAFGGNNCSVLSPRMSAAALRGRKAGVVWSSRSGDRLCTCVSASVRARAVVRD